MSKEGVRLVVGRMIADDLFRQAMKQNPEATLKSSGYSLTAEEIQGLKKLKESDFQIKISDAAAENESFECDVKSAKV